MQKTFNNMWVVVDPEGTVLAETLKNDDGRCIYNFRNNFDKGRWDWGYFLNKGYTCIKVNVTFDIVKE